MKVTPMTKDAPTILAIGAAHLDRRGRPTGTFRKAASNPGVVEESIGGAIFNAACALRLFGVGVVLVSARGGDASGAAVTEAVQTAGMTDLSVTWLDRQTASYTAILDAGGDLVAGIADMAIYDLLAPRVLSRRHLREAMPDADALLLDANLPASTIAHLTSVFAGRPVSAIGVSPAKAVRLSPQLSAISTLFLSRAEAGAIVEASAATGIAVLARLLAEAGAKRAVITDGASDVAILDGGSVLLQAPPKVVRIRDVTGAGDTLAAVATLALLEGASLADAVRLGMAAASRRIGAASVGAGAQTSALANAEAVAAIRTVAVAMAPPRPMDDA